MQTLDVLRDLIAFPTVSARPNRALIDYCAELLRGAGARVQIIADPKEDKANLFASVGPEGDGGIVLSGHTDVVPVEGQAWTVPPFEATVADGRVYGRGTADMKGFVAAALVAVVEGAGRDLKHPLHLALSYDEEIGCLGVRSLIAMLQAAPFRPALCVVGEPTGLAVATGHKGKTAFRVTCRGREAHSALAPTGLNAIHLAADMIQAIRDLQAQVVSQGARDTAYDIETTTLHVGTIEGGTALNIVPGQASFLAEIRALVSDDPEALLRSLETSAQGILAPLKGPFPEADIQFAITNTYPPLETPLDAKAVRFVQGLLGSNGTMKVAFGTEGGLFQRDLGLETVICGPGDMAQGHRADEFVSLDQLAGCDRMLGRLVDRLCTPGLV